MKKMESIFQKIIHGDIPCHRIYENEYVLAFLDVAPLSRGHTLVIPKQPVAFLHELSPESARALGEALVKVAQAVVSATGVSEYNILQNNGATANQAVFHVHFHIIPKPSERDGLCIEWKPVELKDAELLAEEIRNAL
jgi:histidine triad (HIT) family protein